MGAFYTNITVFGPSQESVVRVVSELKRNAFVSPRENGFTVVFDEECDCQEEPQLAALAARLSDMLRCPTLGVLNHDDDIICYTLAVNAQVVDQYHSNPEYFDATARGSAPRGGDAVALCAVFGRPEAADEVQRVLREPAKYVFATEQHQDLARLLGMPQFVVGNSFKGLDYMIDPPIGFMRVSSEGVAAEWSD